MDAPAAEPDSLAIDAAKGPDSHCPRCEYLTGVGRCPECGALNDRVRPGTPSPGARFRRRLTFWLVTSAIVLPTLAAVMIWFAYHYVSDDQLRRWCSQKNTMLARLASQTLAHRFEMRSAAAGRLANAIGQKSNIGAQRQGVPLGWYRHFDRMLSGSGWGFGPAGEYVESSSTCFGKPDYRAFGQVISVQGGCITITAAEVISDRQFEIKLAHMRIGGEFVFCERSRLDDVINAPGNELISSIHLRSQKPGDESPAIAERWPAIELPLELGSLRARGPIEATISDEIQTTTPGSAAQRFRIDAGTENGVFVGLGFWPASSSGAPTFCDGARLTVIEVEPQSCVAVPRTGVRCFVEETLQPGMSVRAGR